MKNNFRAYAASLAASASDSPALGRLGAPPFARPMKPQGGKATMADPDVVAWGCDAMNKGETVWHFMQRRTGMQTFDVEKLGELVRKLNVHLMGTWGGSSSLQPEHFGLFAMAMGLIPAPGSSAAPPREDWWNATREDILATVLASFDAVYGASVGAAVKKSVASGAGVYICSASGTSTKVKKPGSLGPRGVGAPPLAPITRKTVAFGQPPFAIQASARNRCRVMNKGETAWQFLKRTTTAGAKMKFFNDEVMGHVARDLEVVLILDWGGKAEDAETRQNLLQMAMGVVPTPAAGDPCDPGWSWDPVGMLCAPAKAPREDWWNATREDILATSIKALLVDPKNQGYADAIKKGVANGAAVWLCARASSSSMAVTPSPFTNAQPQRTAKSPNAPTSLGTTYDGYGITDPHRWIASCSPSGGMPCAQLQYGAIAPFQVAGQTGALFIMDGVKYQDFANTYGVPYESIKVQKNWHPDHLIAFVPWAAATVAHNTFKIPMAGQSTQVETNTPIQTGSTPGSSSQSLTQSSGSGTPPVKAACPRGWVRNAQGKCVKLPSTAAATPVRSNPFGTTKRPPKIGSVGAPMMPSVPFGGVSSTKRCQAFANENETLWQFANRIAPGPGGGKTKRLDEIAAWHVMIGGRLDSEISLKSSAVAGVAMSGTNVPWWNATAAQIRTGWNAIMAKGTGKPLPPGPYYGLTACPPTISPLNPAMTKPMGVSGAETSGTVGDPSLDVEDEKCCGEVAQHDETSEE